MNRHIWRRRATWGLTVVVLTTGGCSFFPEALQPQNLQKWNRGPGPTADPFYSVPDPIPQAADEADAEADLGTNHAG